MKSEAKPKRRKKICIVCCQHGDEVFGKVVFDFFKEKTELYPTVDLVFANPQAFELRTRFIDTDLNRSFGQQSDLTGYEAEIAPDILRQAKQADYVIDVHTTWADIEYCSIVTRVNKGVKFMLSHIPSEKVVLIESREASTSLIGNVETGISLEFNRDFAKQQEALDIVVDIIEGMLATKPGKFQEKELFTVIGTISNDTAVPTNSKNFELVPSLGIYPILFGENTYTEHQGFSATSKVKLEV